ncbi:MAG: asparagine synthase (glutamine-hydrolyzing) [Candidatus Norongarragalinales archaeon]
MCGICGIAGAWDKALVLKMAYAIRHRGPDANGVFTDKGISLAHNRLAVIDLSARGKQPMCNEDGTIWVVFNGEIYNFKELRRFLQAYGKHRFKSDSDTEVLLHSYEQWGEDFVSRLRGDFAFALWDSKKKSLMLSRDFPGVCPLYYHFDRENGLFYFASEIKGILAAGVKRKVNLEALNDFLSFQYTLGPQTLFEGIFKVQPGETVVFQKGVLRKKTFFSLPPASPAQKTEREWILELNRSFAKSVERRLLSDVPLGVYLSGGLDSSFTAAVMSSLSEKVKTFSVNFGAGFEDEKYSRVVAEALGTEHTELSVDSSNYGVFPQVAWHMDEPAADVAALPTFLMAQKAKKHVTVILTGDGGDEVFGGYERYARLNLLHNWNLVARRLKHFAFAMGSFGDSERVKEMLEHSGDKARLALSYSSALSESEKKLFSSQILHSKNKTLSKTQGFFGKGDFLAQLMDFDLQTLLPDDYLMKVNKTSMAFGLEPRVPFLDRDFVSLTQTLPAGLKVDGFKTKVIMRKLISSVLPEEVVKRKKQGFNVPTRKWLASGLGEIAGQMLDDASVEKRGLLEKSFVKKVLENSKKTETLWGKRFWTLFSLECWHRIFIDPAEAAKPASFAQLGA